MTSLCYALLSEIFRESIETRLGNPIQKEVFHPKTLSYSRDIRLAVNLAVQLSHHVLSLGSEHRPYETETRHVFSQTERLS